MQLMELLERLNPETEVILVLSIILFAGFIMTRLTNTLNMPKVSGYILAGILIGPYCLNFIPEHMIQGMGFISDVALAFIAFGVGKFFKKEVLMRTGRRIIVITVSEALTAGVLVTLVLKAVFRLDWGFALILGAIATATAPASTMMTINQYKAKGEFVNTLLQIVALDDVVCLLAFSIVSAVINGLASGSLSANDILIPIFYNILAIGLGVFCGYFLSRLLIPARSRDNRLILAIAMLLGLTGLCAAVDISPLLSCMVFGAVYINLTRDKKLFRQINNFTPPVMSMFFVVSGMNLDLSALTTVGAIGVGYFIIRIVGKYLGTYLSCMAMGTSREIRNYMGLALIPQAGVAIGLAFLGQRVLPAATGNLMLTIILSSSVLYEMVGPISAKAALFLSGSIPGHAIVPVNTMETEDGRIIEVAVRDSEEPKEGKRREGKLKAGKPKAGEAKAGNPEAEAARAGKPKTENPMAGKPKAGEVETEKLKTEKAETEDPMAGKLKAGEVETEKLMNGKAAAESADALSVGGPADEPGAGEPDEAGKAAAGSPEETPEDRRATENSEEAPEAGTAAENSEEAPKAGTAAEHSEEMPEDKAAAEHSEEAPEGGKAAEDSGETPEGAEADAADHGRKVRKNKGHSGKKKAPKVRKISVEREEEELTTGLPELSEYNKGVDERDDDDVEKILKIHKPKKKKKK